MNMKRTHTLQTGSVLLEALIAILIFSIGILALIGMQTTAINSVADSKYRSQAGFLANQIIGTMWANRTVTINASGVVVAATDPSFTCPAFPTGCNGANSNTYTNAWYNDGINGITGISAKLPRGQASITITPLPIITGNWDVTLQQVTVQIAWQPPKDAISHVHAVSTFIY